MHERAKTPDVGDINLAYTVKILQRKLLSSLVSLGKFYCREMRPLAWIPTSVPAGVKTFVCGMWFFPHLSPLMAAPNVPRNPVLGGEQKDGGGFQAATGRERWENHTPWREVLASAETLVEIQPFVLYLPDEAGQLRLGFEPSLMALSRTPEGLHLPDRKSQSCYKLLFKINTTLQNKFLNNSGAITVVFFNGASIVKATSQDQLGTSKKYQPSC